MTPRVAEEERKPRAPTSPEKHPATAVVREARAVGPGHCGPLNPGKAASAKRIGDESDHPAGKLGEEVHGVLAPEGDGPGRHEGEDTPRLTAPPAQVVDVMDPAVDKDAAPARPGVEPPAALTPIAARDEVKLADLAEPTAGDQPLDVAKRGHEMDVLGDHEDSPRGVGGADHPVGLRERRCDRLLHQDVQARLQRHERVGEVPVVGRAHDRSGGTPVARRFLVRAERRRGAKLAREGAGPPGVAARGEQRDPEAARGPGVAARDPAAPE